MSSKIADYIRRHHVGLLALFVALGGTAAWAADGPNPGQNTIGSEDIIGNEVKSDDIGNGRIFNLDIADNIVTGAKINESTLGQVPSAYAAGNVIDVGFNSCNPSNVYVDCGDTTINLTSETKPLLFATGTVISGGTGSSINCRFTDGDSPFGNQTIFLPASGDIEDFTVIGQAPFFYTGTTSFRFECQNVGSGNPNVFRSNVFVFTAAG